MQLVLQGLAWEECLAYLESDDVIILGHNFQDHTQKLENVFEKFKTYNLKLKPAKCKLFQKEVKFLGKILNAKLGILIFLNLYSISKLHDKMIHHLQTVNTCMQTLPILHIYYI